MPITTSAHFRDVPESAWRWPSFSPAAAPGRGFVAQIVLMSGFPLPQTDFVYGHGTRYAKRCEAV